MFRIANQNAFYLFIIVGIVVLAYIYYRYWYKKSLNKIADSHLLDFIAQDRSSLKTKFKFILSLLSLVLIILGIANVQVGSKIEKKAEARTIDVILAVDISYSMLAEDVKPNRLQRAKMFANSLVEKLKGAKIGIVVFSGDAFVHLPLTIDKGAVRMFIHSITTDMISLQGTNIGKALQLAIEAFERTNAKNRAVILISDGENFELDPIPFAQQAKKENIVIHTAYLGTDEGAPIPSKKNNKLIGYKQDRNGQTVITRPDKMLLYQIASITGGISVDGSLLKESITEIISKLQKLEKKTAETIIFTDYQSLYFYFIIPALILLIIDFISVEHKTKLEEKLRNILKLSIRS